MRPSTSNRYFISFILLAVLGALTLGITGCGTPAGDQSSPATATIPAPDTPTHAPGETLAALTPTPRPTTSATATRVPATEIPIQRELRTAAETATAAPATFTSPDELITSLEADLSERDFSDLQAAMRDPFVFALYPADIRRERPRTVVDELRFRYLPLNTTITFTETNDMVILPAGLLFDGEQPTAVVHSSGWGLAGTGEALLVITETDGTYRWAGLIMAYDGFESLADLETAPPPAGFIYRREDTLWRVDDDGTRQRLIEHAHVERLSLNPSASLALYAESEARTVTLVRPSDVPAGERETIELDATLMTGSERIQWLNDTTAVLAVTSERRVVQSTTGHLALLDVNNGQLTMLGPEVSVYTRFSVGPDERIVYDARRAWHEGQIVPPVPHGATALDAAIEQYEGLWNPVLSPDGTTLAGVIGGDFGAHTHGYVVVDVRQRASSIVHTFDAPDTDAALPWGITWSPGSRWLTLDPPSWDPVEDGVWVVSPDGTTQRFLGIGTHTPVWIDAHRVVFAATVGGDTRLHLYNVATDRRVALDAPAGAQPVHYVPAQACAGAVPARPSMLRYWQRCYVLPAPTIYKCNVGQVETETALKKESHVPRHQCAGTRHRCG